MPNGLDFKLNDVPALEATPAERQREYEARWAQGGVTFMGSFADLLFNQTANDTAAEFVRRKIRETVRDPKVAETLSPRNVIGCKRLCVDTGYWETFNRPNVTLVDVSGAPIEEITARRPQGSGRGVPARRDRFRHRVRCHDGGFARGSISAAGPAGRSRRSGSRARAPISGWRWRASPTCSPSPARAALRF